MEYVYVILIAFAVIKTAESLYCWKCQSYEDGACRDSFNVTTANNGLTLRTSIDSQQATQENCDSFLALYIPSERAVCMKKVEMLNGRKYYTRKCEYIRNDQPIGDCKKKSDNQQYHSDQSTTNNVEFCELCSTPFCNDANQLKTTRSWLIAVPVISFLLLRY